MKSTRNYKEKTEFKPNYKRIKKSLVIVTLFSIFCVCILISYSKNNVNAYKELFISGKYIEAKNYYENKTKSVINKKLSFDGKVANFLDEQLNSALEKYNKSEINDEAAINLINEIKGYNLLSEDTLNNSIYEIKSNEVLKEINALLKDNKNYESTLKAISEAQSQYPKLEGLATAEKQALAGLKATILTEGKTLSDEGNLSEAISKLESKASYFPSDSEYITVLNDYKAKKAEELRILEEQKREEEAKRKIEEEKKKAAAALAVNTSLKRADYKTSEEFINATNLSSSRSYLIYVNLEAQTTEVFKGSRGNWKLIYSFISSTGKTNSPTPRGVYKVTGRGSWFFSEQFQEGGMYYVQFWGDYLFHSLPMDINKNVVDSTLGTPASHGCVRLAVDQAKWLYDNIPNETTVFIK